MTKIEFIHILEKKLACINCAEREEIIIEYSQNIEDKILYGINEEAAVAGFGNPSELAKELISTYKSDHLFFVKSIRNRLEFYVKRVKHSVDTCQDKCKNAIQEQKTQRENKNENKLQQSMVRKGTAHSIAGTTTRVAKGTVYKIGQGVKFIGTSILKLVYGILIVLLGIPVIGYIVLLGVSVVLACLQYPVVGITILLLGSALLSGTILISVWCKKFNIICTSICIVGLLLIGVGTAITFVEVTSLETTTYEIKTDPITYTDQLSTSKKELDIYTYVPMEVDVIQDKNVAMGEVHVTETNTKGMDFYAYIMDEDSNIASMYFNSYDENQWMPTYISKAIEAIKMDQVLIPSVSDESIQVKITVHPDMKIQIR